MAKDMARLLLVALGGGGGAVARYLVGMAWLSALGPSRPWGATLLVNVLGGLLMGMLVGTLAARGEGGSDRWRLLLGVGLLGGFTTFSTFSLDAMLMLQRREFGGALAYVAGSAVLSIAALGAGLALTRRALAP